MNPWSVPYYEPSANVDWYGNPIPVGSILQDDGTGNTVLTHPDGTEVHSPSHAQQYTMYPLMTKPYIAPPIPTKFVPEVYAQEMNWSKFIPETFAMQAKKAAETMHELAKKFSGWTAVKPEPHRVVDHAAATIGPCTCSAGTDHDAGQEDFDGDITDEFDPETMA